MIWAQTTSMYSNTSIVASIVTSIVASIVASRAKVAPFALCLLVALPPSPFTRSCDLWLWCLVAPDLVQHHGIKMKEASMPANGENQFRHGGVVIVLYDLLCGDIDLFAECPG